MTKVFVGGSRRVARLNKQVKERLDSIIDKRFLVLVGDANGADRAVQQHLCDRGYRNVEVFCVDGACRNNLGDWRLRSVTPTETRKSLDYYASKDREMASQADVGFMVWDAKSAGTLLNALRLVTKQKKTVVFDVPAKQFITVRNHADFEALLATCAKEIRQKVVTQLRKEGLSIGSDREPAQAELKATGGNQLF